VDLLVHPQERETMGKYSKFQQKSASRQGLHPIWRGIGCILIVVVPLIGYWLTIISLPLIIATGRVPYQLMGYIHFPAWAFTVPVISSVASFIGGVSNLWLNIITFFIIVLLLTAVASLLYSMLYALVGPARYTELDAPPAKYKTKKYTR
jgi:hypothetical protein